MDKFAKGVDGGDHPGPHVPAVEDDGDCTVDNADFTAMLAAWGPCPESGGQVSDPGQGSSLLSLPEAVQLLGFADPEAYVAWASGASEAEVLASAEILGALLQ
jgi:hypothetical protein